MPPQYSVSLLHFHFHNFHQLPTEAAINSGPLTDHTGNSWELRIHPGGYTFAAAIDGFCSLALRFIGGPEGNNKKDKEEMVHVIRTFIVRDSEGRSAFEIKHGFPGGGRGFVRNCWRRVSNFAKRSTILDNLVDGTLYMDVLLQYSHNQKDEAYHATAPISNPFSGNLLALLDSGEEADVSFQVHDEIITAHQLILRTNAPILASFCSTSDEDISVPIPIQGTSPEVFRLLLRYIYGGNAPDRMDMIRLGVDIIDAADRYEIVGLKLATEEALVASGAMFQGNVADYLLFADAKNCALLKEYATSFFVVRAKDVLDSDRSVRLCQSPRLLKELIVATVEYYDLHSCHGRGSCKNMAVDELRRELGKRALDMDGSREMLVSRLQNDNKSDVWSE